MSMKPRKGGIKAEYERALKAAKERRRYYIKKSGGLYLPEIKRKDGCVASVFFGQ